MSNFYKTYWSTKLTELKPWLDNYVDPNDTQDCSFSGNGVSSSFPPIFQPVILLIEETENNIEITFDLNTYNGLVCSATTIEYLLSGASVENYVLSQSGDTVQSEATDNVEFEQSSGVTWTEVAMDCESPQSIDFSELPDGIYQFRLKYTDTYGQDSPYSEIYYYELNRCYLMTENYEILNTYRWNKFITEDCDV